MCKRHGEYSSLVTLTFNLVSGVQGMCDACYLCANFGLPRPVCSRLRPDICNRRTLDDRQTDRQTSDSIIAQCPCLLGVGAQKYRL